MSLPIDDFNDDNCLDLVMTNIDTGTITGYLKFGNGNFQSLYHHRC